MSPDWLLLSLHAKNIQRMKNIISFTIIICLLVIVKSCNTKDKKSIKPEQSILSSDSLLEYRYQQILQQPLDSLGIPRSFDITTNTLKKLSSSDWTSGFFSGSLWQIYQLTGNEEFKQKAKDWTAFMEKEKNNSGTHDIGFMIFSSYGKAWQITGNKNYASTVVQTAKTLTSRFNKNVKAIRSWDWNQDVWEFPVIIDNMMNLELLFEATKISNDSIFHNIAEQHANTTLKNHFRNDNSTYHVIIYDTIQGNAINKVTHQGINDESDWARGQAWAIYGYTMAYRYVKNPAYIKQAETTLQFYLSHPNLPEDGIPFWDFDDPKIPNAPKDVSAAAIIASACYELFSYTQKEKYRVYADHVIKTLNSENYLLPRQNQSPFILGHSTGNKPKNDEIDVPINYADYYFLEALVRQKNLNKNK